MDNSVSWSEVNMHWFFWNLAQLTNFLFGSLEFSNCTNPAVENSLNKVNEEIATGKDPSESLNGLTDVLKENEVASGNVVQLDLTIKFAIEKQTQLLLESSDPNFKNSNSKNFTNAIVDVNNELLNSELAFWGLESNARGEQLDQLQKNIDDTLFLLAENLLDGVYKNNDNPNIGNAKVFWNERFLFNTLLTSICMDYSRSGGKENSNRLQQSNVHLRDRR